MKVFICIDDLGGMLFNNRRQSRDRIMIADMRSDVGDGILFISPFSEKLLADQGIKLKVHEGFLSDAKASDSCFVENMPLAPYIDKIEELVIYKWNREYPSDMKLDIDPLKCGLKLRATDEFAGSSHDKITKEIYTK